MRRLPHGPLIARHDAPSLEDGWLIAAYLLASLTIPLCLHLIDTFQIASPSASHLHALDYLQPFLIALTPLPHQNANAFKGVRIAVDTHPPPLNLRSARTGSVSAHLYDCSSNCIVSRQHVCRDQSRSHIELSP